MVYIYSKIYGFYWGSFCRQTIVLRMIKLNFIKVNSKIRVLGSLQKNKFRSVDTPNGLQFKTGFKIEGG